ncbi:hypothetical protein L5515_010097 [Caenorhabditis briggsae]|uniref:SCP domain-containing protein n=1 Tax=Caenorhabditis briggsae TaxID=6238 RepID=A0AAE9JCR7_CAEBR|nr:hypothetical protein L5515_010097 [Caenorhabditis briggsae]
MKNFLQLIFGILLILKVSPSPIENSKQHEIIASLNDFRLKFAKIAQIANMYQLEYSNLRENEAKNYTNYCPLPKDFLENQPNYEPVPEQFVKKFLEYSEDHLKDLNKTDQFFGTKYYFSDVLRPLYMEVGCAKLEKSCALKLKNTASNILDGQEISVDYVCIFGPYMEPADLDRMDGPPGSACVYGKAENGILCKKATVLEAID